jgi:hypothetical protein
MLWGTQCLGALSYRQQREPQHASHWDMSEPLHWRLELRWNMLVEVNATIACVGSLVQAHWLGKLNLVYHVAQETPTKSLGLVLGRQSVGHVADCLATRLVSMVLERFAAQVRGLATEAIVGQEEVHTDLTVALQQHSAPGDCSVSRCRRCRQQHNEPQYHPQVVRQVQRLESLVGEESLWLPLW